MAVVKVRRNAILVQYGCRRRDACLVPSEARVQCSFPKVLPQVLLRHRVPFAAAWQALDEGKTCMDMFPTFVRSAVLLIVPLSGAASQEDHFSRSPSIAPDVRLDLMQRAILSSLAYCFLGYTTILIAVAKVGQGLHSR